MERFRAYVVSRLGSGFRVSGLRIWDASGHVYGDAPFATLTSKLWSTWQVRESASLVAKVMVPHTLVFNTKLSGMRFDCHDSPVTALSLRIPRHHSFAVAMLHHH